MKKLSAFACLALISCLLGSPAAASEKAKGTIREVDENARTIRFSAEGGSKDEVLAVDKAVDLKKVKANAKAQITRDGGVVTEIKTEVKRSAPGY